MALRRRGDEKIYMTLMLFVIVLMVIYKIKIYKTVYNYEYLDKDGTRMINGIFVVLVFLSHFCSYIEVGKYDYLYQRVQSCLGQFIVVPFLFYSGYGIMLSIKRKGMQYVLKIPYDRLLKIWCHFVFAVLLFLIVEKCILHHEYDVQTILLSFLAWDTVGNSNWYIFVTLIVYIFTYFSFRIARNINWGIVLMTFLSIMYIIIIKNVKDNWWYDTIVVYVLGMIYASFKEKIENWLFIGNIRYVFCFVLVLISDILVIFLRGNFVTLELFYILTFVLLLLATMKVKINNLLLDFFGKYTFEIYILQRIPMNIFKDMFENKYIYFIVCILVTLMLAIVFRKFTNWFDMKIVRKN